MKVLVPLDGSKFSEEVLPYLTKVPAGQGHAVTLLRVGEPPREHIPMVGAATLEVAYYPPPDLETRGQAIARIENEALSYLRTKAKEMPGLTVNCKVAISHEVAAEIIETANREHADMIAMTTHGRTGLLELVMGSVANAILHHSKLPVLLVKPKRGRSGRNGSQTDRAIEHVIVPLDGTVEAERALAKAQEMAKLFGASVVLVQVLKRGAERSLASRDVLEEGYLAGIASRLVAEGVHCEWEVLHDSKPDDRIVDFAAHTAGALIVMMSRNRPHVTEALLGSVSRQVVASGVAPVLLLRPD